jgi:hypothetical protein
MANNTEDLPSRTTLECGLLNFSMPMQAGNAWFSEEPDLTEENVQIWKSQVLIPHFDSKHAYLGRIEKTGATKFRKSFLAIKNITL